MKKRVLSMLLVLVMVVGLLPMTAFAADENNISATCTRYTVNFAVTGATVKSATPTPAGDNGTLDIVVTDVSDGTVTVNTTANVSLRHEVTPATLPLDVTTGEATGKVVISGFNGVQQVLGGTWTINVTVEGDIAPYINFTTDLDTAAVEYFTGTEAEPLRVAVETNVEGEIGYQWYSNTTNSAENGTPIGDASGASYTPETTTTGTTYYYAVATCGDLKATSKVATVTVKNKDPQTIVTGDQTPTGSSNEKYMSVVTQFKIEGAIVNDWQVSDDCLTWDVELNSGTFDPQTDKLNFTVTVKNTYSDSRTKDAYVAVLNGTPELERTDFEQPQVDQTDYIYTVEDFAPVWNDSGEAKITVATAYKAGSSALYKPERTRTYTLNLKLVSSEPVAPELVDPYATAASKSTMVGNAYTLNVAELFQDKNGDALTYKVTAKKDGSPVEAGSISSEGVYTFTPSETGVYTLEFKANDGTSDSPAYTVTLTVAENKAPVASKTSDTVTIKQFASVKPELNEMFTDENEGDTLYYFVKIGESAEFVPVDENWTYPNLKDGEHTLVFRCKDGAGAEGTCTVTLKVTKDPTGVAIGHSSDKGSLNFIKFYKGYTLITPVSAVYNSETKVIDVTLPRDFGRTDKVRAVFDLTQTEAKPEELTSYGHTHLPFLSRNNKTAGSSNVKNGIINTSQETTLAAGRASFTFYYHISNPKPVNSVEFTINYVLENNKPVLTSGTSATATTPARADYVPDLSGIFEDPDAGETLSYKVSVDGAPAVDVPEKFSWDYAGTHTLRFTASDGQDESTATYTITVTVTNAVETYDVAVTVPAGVEPDFYYTEKAQSGTELEKTGPVENVYTVKVPLNISTISWRYDGMGMSADVDAETNNALTLVTAEFTVKAGEEIDSGATVEVSRDRKTIVGNNNTFLLLDGGGYTFKAIPGSDYSDDYLDETYTDQTASAEIELALKYNAGIPVTVPAEAALQLRPASHAQGTHSGNLAPIEGMTMENGDGTMTYYFALTPGVIYECRVDMGNYPTYARTFKRVDRMEIIVTEGQLSAGGNLKNTVDRDIPLSNGVDEEGRGWLTSSDFSLTVDHANFGDVLLNVNAKGYLKLAENGTYQLHPARSWMAVNFSWANERDDNKYAYIEPDFHFTVVDEAGQPSSNVVTVDENGKLTAVGQGTAIVLVTYDAMNVEHDPEVRDGEHFHNQSGFYGAIWPENTGVFVVSVGAADSGITTGMTINEEKMLDRKQSGSAIDSELDVIYFVGDEGEYTFTPVTKGVSVSVANPTVSATAMSFTGFVSVEANEDGSVTVPLKEGRNIVKLVKDGNAEYQLITAKSVSVTVNGQPLDQAVLAPGDSVKIVFDRLYGPANRMSMYNTSAAIVYSDVSGYDGKLAGAPRGSYGYYYYAGTLPTQTIENLVSATVDDSGYANSMVRVDGELKVPENYKESSFDLKNGVFNIGGMSKIDAGGHREFLGIAVNSAYGNDARLTYLGRLPDISIPTATLSDITVTAQPTTTEYDIGDVFDPAGMEVSASYTNSAGAFDKVIDDYTFDTTPFGEAGSKTVTVTYTFAGVTRTATVNVTVNEAVLDRIEITEQPEDTQYRPGEAFDPTGMVVTAYYSDGSDDVVTNYTWAPEILGVGDTKVTVTYGEKTADVTVTVCLVERLEITTRPTKTEYTEGEYFALDGMVVTAVYGDGFEKILSDSEFTFAPQGALTTENTAVTITYAGSEGADNLQPVTVNITVSAAGGQPGGKPDDEPEKQPITVFLSYSEYGAFVNGVDGTLLYNVPVTVSDDNKDGVFTIGEAFKAFHVAYYRGGELGYADNGRGTTKFWGENVHPSYVLNHSWVGGVYAEIASGDKIGVFKYQDYTMNPDLYTWFAMDSYSAKAGEPLTLTVNGLSVMGSGEISAAIGSPEGATVTVYDSNGRTLTELSTTTDANGRFSIVFPTAGYYTIEVSGTCNYTQNGQYAPGSYENAVVVPSRCTVVVSASTATAEDKAAAAEVDKLIDAIGTVTKDSGDAIDAAREAYDKLSNKQQKLVSNYDELVAAEKKYAELTGKLAFSDISKDAYYYEAVKWAVEMGITNGTGDDTFSPEESCTRAQMVTFLWRAAGKPKAKNTTCVFTDVDADSYYYEALLWAVENGITNGTSATTFSPDEDCNRGQMAAFLYRSAETPTVSGDHDFNDVEADAYYNDAVIWAAEQKITNGTSDTTFSPDEDCTRGQMVTFLYRYLAE